MHTKYKRSLLYKKKMIMHTKTNTLMQNNNTHTDVYNKTDMHTIQQQHQCEKKKLARR